MTIVVAICAHENTAQLSSMLRNWRRSLGGDDRVYLLFDASKTKPPKDPHLLQFTNEECAAANTFHVSNWANVEYKIYLLFRAFEETGADFVWMIESDVGCDGDIATCLDRVASSRADFMAFRTKSYADEPEWAWWNSLKGEIVDTVPLERRVGSFFPVTRYSRAMLDAVIRNMGKSSGFCEAYIPTLAISEGLVVGELPAAMEGDIGFAIYDRLPGRNDHRLYHKYVTRPSSSSWHIAILVIACVVVCIIIAIRRIA
jgi:hypothetical protein